MTARVAPQVGSRNRPRRGSAAFSEEEKALLQRYLKSYCRLHAGELPANTPARRRFIEVADQRLPPVAIHEVAFVKWQMWMGLRPREALQPVVQRQQAASASPAPLVTPTVAPDNTAAARHGAVPAAEGKAEARPERGWDRVADWFNASLGTDFARRLDQWMRDTFATAKPTIYDKAMDATHIATPSGPFHRLWDGGHSLPDAWRAVVDASPHDTFVQEVTGYLSAVWKDVVTPMGLPFATVNRDWFNATQVSFKDMGVTKSQLADALSYTGSELAGAALGAIALLLNWNKAETERAATLAGSLGMSTLCAANPVLGIVAIACLARAIQTAKAASGKEGFVVGIMKGGFGSAALVATSSIVGGPVWVGLVAGIVASMVVHHAVSKGARQIKDVDWSRLGRSIVGLARSRDRASPTLLLQTG